MAFDLLNNNFSITGILTSFVVFVLGLTVAIISEQSTFVFLPRSGICPIKRIENGFRSFKILETFRELRDAMGITKGITCFIILLIAKN